MEQKSPNEIIMQQPMPVANRFIWIIKDFSEYHENSTLKSPEFILNTADRTKEKLRLEITEGENDNEDSDSDEDEFKEVEYKLVFCIDSEFDTKKKLVVIYSILDKNGKVIHDEQKVLITIQPKVKVREKFSLIEIYDIKDLIFRHGIMIMHICVVDITLDETIITNLMNSDNNEKDLQPRIVKQFSNFYETKDLCDFVIMVGNQKFHVHKFALAASSPVFATLFIHEAKSVREGHMIITDATSEVVQQMLEYIYTGSVNNIEGTAKDLLKIAHKYNLDGLVKMCANHLKKTINIDNVLSTLAFATKYNVEDLKLETQMFFIANTKNILNGEEFNDFISSYAYSFDNSL